MRHLKIHIIFSLVCWGKDWKCTDCELLYKETNIWTTTFNPTTTPSPYHCDVQTVQAQTLSVLCIRLHFVQELCNVCQFCCVKTTTPITEPHTKFAWQCSLLRHWNLYDSATTSTTSFHSIKMRSVTWKQISPDWFVHAYYSQIWQSTLQGDQYKVGSGDWTDSPMMLLMMVGGTMWCSQAVQAGA